MSRRHHDESVGDAHRGGFRRDKVESAKWVERPQTLEVKIEEYS
jgi:hypothetical protein